MSDNRSVTPEACDHEGPDPCSRCCPCRECWAIRHEEEEEEDDA